MPLVRFGVRNEYGLGQPELYRAADKEDPKAVLEGVAVAGLVGILRQLGDLAEFAAEVFHGLQEQVTATASRSHKLAVRVEHIEAALPPLEKAVLAQTSHIHFAYTAGTEWHPRIRNEQNHFIYNDLPRFIMDSYEECRPPPCLHVLDKFDAGGSGSCLRRYSDPNFFKRIAGNSTEETSEKIRREKRPRKSKKKKSSRRNGEFSHLASVSIHSGRMASPVVHATSSSRTASVADTMHKSDLGDHSDSFDLRSRSGHIEGDFNQSSSLQHGEQESMVSSSRFVPHIDIMDSTFSDEPTQMVDNNTLSTPSQEHIAPTSSGVSWDEKAEIVESMGKRSDRGEAPELVSENFDIDRQGTTTAYLRNTDESLEVISADLNQDIEDGGYADLRNTDEAQETAKYDLDAPDRRAANFKTIDQMDIQPADEDTSKSVSKRNQLDENESETDYYMDALNTIESESENDLDCQTKREIEQSSSAVNNGKVENRMDALVAHSPDYYSPNIDPHSVSNGVSSSLPDPVPSESITHEPTPQISGESCDSDHSRDADVCKSADIVDVPNIESAVSHRLKVESAISSPPSSGSPISDPQDQSRDKIISRVHESQESHTEMSCFQPVKFWTNGGLLGLEPSKPPVVSPNATSQDHIGRSKSEIVGPQNQSDEQKEKLDTLVENTERSGNDSICGTEKIPFSFDCLDAQSGKSAASCNSNTSDHNHRGGLDVSAKGASKTELAPDAKATSSEASEENDRNSSLVFGLGHRLLVNGFPRSSLEHDERSESVGHLISGGFDQEHRQHHVTHRTIPDNAFIEQFGRGSPLNSRTSSPPLEHMKISFNPADGFEMSKLKLKFPDGSHYHESIRDTFPSFQLVPEPASPSYNHVSDSDDDTFCHSSPYMSDDHLSQQSESNSEEWESSGSPRASTEQELYDALSRMSSMGSVSSSLLVEGTKNDMCIDRGLQSIYNGNDAEPNLLVLDLPSFDTMNTVLERETKAISDPENLKKVQEDRVDAPVPPPPPPVQWQVSKPQSDVAEVEQCDRSEAFKDALQGKLADLRLANKETLESKQESKVHQQKFYAVKEANKNANGVGMDEKEDFLHQIRTKSFSLRPTAPAKPTFTSGPATNTKVTAILEKANAIRKAVGSDTGDDDDNWSDA